MLWLLKVIHSHYNPRLQNLGIMLSLFIHLEYTIGLDIFNVQKWVEANFDLFHILNLLDNGANFLEVLPRLHEIFDALLFLGDGWHYIPALLILNMAKLMQKPHLLLIQLIHQLIPRGPRLQSGHLLSLHHIIFEKSYVLFRFCHMFLISNIGIQQMFGKLPLYEVFKLIWLLLPQQLLLFHLSELPGDLVWVALLVIGRIWRVRKFPGILILSLDILIRSQFCSLIYFFLHQLQVVILCLRIVHIGLNFAHLPDAHLHLRFLVSSSNHVLNNSIQLVNRFGLFRIFELILKPIYP